MNCQLRAIDLNFYVMNRCVFVSLFLFVFSVSSQTTEVVLDEQFDSNINKWVSDGQLFKLSNGVLKVESSAKKDQFNFSSKVNRIEADRSMYTIKADIKIESLSEGARSGIALANAIDTTTREMLSGYVFYIELYKGKHFLSCHNIDDKTPKEFIGFDLFPLGEYIELKISINSTIGSCEVFINNDRAYDLEGPLFNINQVGLYGKGDVVSECTKLSVEQSKTVNTTYAFDLIDSQYDDLLKVNRIYRGRHDFDLLTNYVPRVILCDNLYNILAKQSDFTFDDLISDLLDDLDCKIEKSSYTNASNPNLKYYKLQYKDVSFVVSYSKDSKYVVSTSIIFKTTKDATTFFEEYVRLKKFSNQRTQDEVKYASHPLMPLSFISQSENTVNFLY